MVTAKGQKRTRRGYWLGKVRKVLRWALVAVIAVLMLVVLVLAVPGSRSMVLEKVLGLVTGSLPGQMTLAKSSWPRLGTIEIDGVLWVAPGEGAVTDTLVVLDRLVIQLDIPALGRRQLGVRSLDLELASLDIPAISRATVGDSVSIDQSPAAEPSPLPFFHEGSWPLFPDSFINELNISLERGMISPELALRHLNLSGGLNLQAESNPRVWLSNSNFGMASLGSDTLRLEVEQLGLALRVDPAARSALIDSLAAVIPEAGNRSHAQQWRNAGGAWLSVSGSGTGSITEGGPVTLSGDFHLPGPGHFTGLIPEDFPMATTDPVDGHFDVTVQFAKELENITAGSVRLKLAPTSWMEQALVVGQFDQGSAQLDTCDLSLLGTRLQVSGAADTSRVDLKCLAELADGRILELFGGEEIKKALRTEWPPEGGARLDLVGSARGGISRGGEISLSGVFQVPGPGNFTGILPAVFPLMSLEPGRGRFEVTAQVASNFGSVDTGSLRLEMEPTEWIERALIVGNLSQQTVQVDTCDLSLLGARLQVSGMADTSRVDLECLAELTDGRILELFVDEDLKAALTAEWPAEGGAWVDLVGSAEGGISSGGKIALSGGFQVPGPGNFSRVLPAGFPLTSQEPGRGRFDVTAQVTSNFGSIDSGSVRLEMEPADWIERALVVGQFAQQSVQVDTCDLSLLGASVVASGTADTSGVDLECLAELADGRILEFFGGEKLKTALASEWPDEGGAWVDLVGRAEGRISSGGKVALSGTFQVPGPGNFSEIIPTKLLLTSQEPGRGRFDVTAQVTSNFESIDSGSVRLKMEPADWIERAHIVGQFAQHSVQVDTCDLSLLGASVLASGTADTTEFDLNCLAELTDGRLLQIFGGEDFHGSQATARFEGRLAGPIKRPDLDLDLKASLETSELIIPRSHVVAGAHGDEVFASVTISGGVPLGTVVLDSLQARWDGTRLWDPTSIGDFSQAFHLQAWSRTMDLRMVGAAGGDTLRQVRIDSLELRLQDEVASLSKPVLFQYLPEKGYMTLSSFSLPMGSGGLDLAGHYSESGIELAAGVDVVLEEVLLQKIFPSEIWSRDGGLSLALKGQLDFEGSPAGPVFQGDMRAVAIHNRDTPNLIAETTFGLAPGETVGLRTDIQLSAGEQSLLKGFAIWPGKVNPADGRWKPDPLSSLVVDVPSQQFTMAQLNPFLPPDVSLDGNLDFSLHLTPENSPSDQLSGQVKTKGLKINLPNSSRINMDVALELGGELKDPKVSGKIQVNSGFFRIPEIPRNLLPVEGESLLWQVEIDGMPVVDPDSLALAHMEQGPVLNTGGQTFLPDLDVEIKLPGKLTVHGYGLNVELEGNLQVARGFDEEGVPGPAITGYVGVSNGTMKFMNRVFTFISSEVKFQGSVPVDPLLKVVLESDISGYLVRLMVEGSGLKPEVTMTSEPELKEEDIMALLIFGQPASDLDSDQRGRMQEENDPKQQLQQNMAALAVVMGTSGLQNTVSESLGIDMVEMGADSKGDSTLMVGKYVSPRVLVKYNQSLEKSGTYFMTLDYTINKFFKLVSTYGQGEEDSGVEVRWTRRF